LNNLVELVGDGVGQKRRLREDGGEFSVTYTNELLEEGSFCKRIDWIAWRKRCLRRFGRVRLHPKLFKSRENYFLIGSQLDRT
jgi:hypothetical protein